MQPTWGPGEQQRELLPEVRRGEMVLGLPEEARPEGAGASWTAGQQRG